MSVAHSPKTEESNANGRIVTHSCGFCGRTFRACRLRRELPEMIPGSWHVPARFALLQSEPRLYCLSRFCFPETVHNPLTQPRARKLKLIQKKIIRRRFAPAIFDPESNHQFRQGLRKNLCHQ